MKVEVHSLVHKAIDHYKKRTGMDVQRLVQEMNDAFRNHEDRSLSYRQLRRYAEPRPTGYDLPARLIPILVKLTGDKSLLYELNKACNVLTIDLDLFELPEDGAIGVHKSFLKINPNLAAIVLAGHKLIKYISGVLKKDEDG